jgi:hypothetical protein
MATPNIVLANETGWQWKLAGSASTGDLFPSTEADVGPRRRFSFRPLPGTFRGAEGYLRYELADLSGAAVVRWNFPLIGTKGFNVETSGANYPDRFFRHFRYEIRLDPPGDQNWWHDSTFAVQPGLANGLATSFQAYYLQDLFLRHSNYKLYVQPMATPLDRSDATFWRRPI